MMNFLNDLLAPVELNMIKFQLTTVNYSLVGASLAHQIMTMMI